MKEELDLIKTSKVRESIKGVDMFMSADVTDKVNNILESLIRDAVARAKANNRKTVQAKDF